MGIKVANNAFGTLAAGINSSATSITLTTGQGARFPTLGAGDYFYATLIDTSNNLEIVKVTARSTDVLTVVRAQESTTARAYSAGDRIEIRLTAQTFLDATGVTSSDITTALGYTPANKAGDTFTGTVNINAGGGTVLDVKDGGDIVLRNAGNSLSVPLYCDADNRLTVGNASGNGFLLARNAASAWVAFGGGDRGRTAGTIYSAFNVSSITVQGTGQYRVNYTSALNNSIHPAVCCSDDIAGVGFTIVSTGPDYSGMSTTFAGAWYRNVGNTFYNAPVCSFVAFGT